MNSIREIERQRAAFADENGVRLPGGGVRPLTVAMVRGLFTTVLVVYGIALVNLLFLLTDFSISHCIEESVLIVVATFALFKLRDSQRRAVEYERADRQFVARRREIIDQLRKMYEQNASGASPGEGRR